MMVTPTQKKTIQGIVNIFETGSVLGNYGSVTLIAGDTGHLTFGRSQTTLGSGGLAKLMARYCSNPGARFGDMLAPYLARLQARDLDLDHDRYLHNLLRTTADDPVMRETQDQFFDDIYWAAAQRASQRSGITTPLGMAVVYDSLVHGSWPAIRDRTTKAHGTMATLGEPAWITAYVQVRRAWLGCHSNKALHATVYRMDALMRLIELQQWGLALPLVVRGCEISPSTLNGLPPGCFDGPPAGSRALVVTTPLLRGADVRLLQLGLSRLGMDIKADGIYGRDSARHVEAYQERIGMPATGSASVELIMGLAG